MNPDDQDLGPTMKTIGGDHNESGNDDDSDQQQNQPQQQQQPPSPPIPVITTNQPTQVQVQPSLQSPNNDLFDQELAIFSELSQLCHNKDGLAWREMARWVKYEENVEANGTRWSKPYVSTVNVAAFNELRDSFRNGVVLFDSQCYSLDQLVEEFCHVIRAKNMATTEESKRIANVLCAPKLHLFQTKRSLMRSLADMRQNSSNNFLKLLSGSTTKINCTTINEMDTVNGNGNGDGVPKTSRRNSLSHSDPEDNGDRSSEHSSQKSTKHGSASNLQAASGQNNHANNTNSSNNNNHPHSNHHHNHHHNNNHNQNIKDHKYSDHYKFNDAFMRKLPDNVVSNNILVGEVDFLHQPISGFIRLQNATVLGNMTEVSVPTKFIFVYLGPKVNPAGLNYAQIGRALATLMSDMALDDFLNESPILPPNLWDPATRIEPPEKTPQVSQGNRGRQMQHDAAILLQKDLSQNASLNTMSSEGAGSGGEPDGNHSTITSQSYFNKAFFIDANSNNEKVLQSMVTNGGGGGGPGNGKDFDSYACYIDDKIHMDSDDEEEMERRQNGLVRTGRCFGGLINDVKRKLPHYKSDFTDALSMQSVASVVYLYFACLTPIITFGGLLGDATGNNIATMESLVCGCLCGIVYGLFSGQPLTILGSTGPVLVFETIVFDYCRSHDYNYLALRFWIGVWTAAILMLFVAFDLSYFVCYITRFTEENFASLISVIFIYKSIEKLLQINHDHPIHLHPSVPLDYECYCLLPDGNGQSDFLLQSNQSNPDARLNCLQIGGRLNGPGCGIPNYVSDVFLFCLICLSFTYIISVKLKAFIKTRYFTSTIRQLISDFAVPIAIVVMTVIDNLTGLPTPKLQVPSNFKPTLPTRTWIVSPLAPENPSWLPIAALIPATLATILIFMDQQITAVIVNRKENKLKKGCGYHLDLFVLSILIGVCSIFGLPWFVAATVLSITHVNSLKMVSQTAAPGDRPKFLGVREQRVTHICIFLLCGLSIFFTPILQRVPMAVLYGVFLYMGVSSLHGSQFINRIAIMFMPQKYQPDYMFLRRVRMYRVHLFTIIQIICFIVLWAVKSSKPISIAFPLMLVVMLGVRKLLDYIFTQEELKVLDDKMPESKRKKKERTKARLSMMMVNREKQHQQHQHQHQQQQQTVVEKMTPEIKPVVFRKEH